MKKGDSVKLSTTHSDGSIITYRAKIFRINIGGTAWVEIPRRVRNLPFPPYKGKRFAQFYQKDLWLA